MKKYHRRFEIVKRLLSIPLPRNVDSIWGKILSRNISFDRWSIRDAIDTEGKGGEKKKKKGEDKNGRKMSSSTTPIDTMITRELQKFNGEHW